jgi:hypothetical protein
MPAAVIGKHTGEERPQLLWRVEAQHLGRGQMLDAASEAVLKFSRPEIC